MQKVTRRDKEKVVDILTASFIDNKSCRYVVGNKLRSLRILMEYSFENCFKNGEVLLSENGKCCMLILSPGKKKLSIRLLLWEIYLALFGIGLVNLPKVLKRESHIAKNKFKGNNIYLWFIGTDPKWQGRGEGSRALTYLTELAANQNLPVLCETSTQRNIPFYERYGFKKYNSSDVFGFNFLFYKYEFVRN